MTEGEAVAAIREALNEYQTNCAETAQMPASTTAERLERLRAQRAKRDAAALFRAHCNPDAITTILAALDREKADAKRLQWIADHADVILPTAQPFMVGPGQHIWSTRPSGVELRAAVDAALSQHEQGASQ